MIALVVTLAIVRPTERHKAYSVAFTRHALALGRATRVATVAGVTLRKQHWVLATIAWARKQAAQSRAVAHGYHQLFKDHLTVL